MKAKRAGAGWLPQQIIDHQSSAGPVTELSDGGTQIFAQHHVGDITVGFPAIADLTGQTGIAFTFLPIDLVGSYTGFELAAKHPIETGTQHLDRVVFDQLVDDEKTVLVKTPNPFSRRLAASSFKTMNSDSIAARTPKPSVSAFSTSCFTSPRAENGADAPVYSAIIRQAFDSNG
tara:strand:- start:4 stop:528 length:525 start_codon:yes stop_codon:yes gene_type:complete